MGRERVREEGLEQCRAAVSSLANLSDLGVRQSSGSKLVTPGLSSPAGSPQDRKWPKEGLLCLSHLSIYLSIYNNLPILGLLFWVPGSYEASEVQGKKKKNPASQKPIDSRISFSLSPGPGDTARPHSAWDGRNPVPTL